MYAECMMTIALAALDHASTLSTPAWAATSVWAWTQIRAWHRSDGSA